MATDLQDISVEEGPEGGRYVWREGPDAPEAELTFRKAALGRVIADHTMVPEEYRKRGIGRALVQRMVNDARGGHHCIEPRCSFVTAMFDEHPDWRDVLAPAWGSGC